MNLISYWAKTKQALVLAAIISTAMWLPSNAQGEQLYYRYLDDNGVKVLNHIIPPRFAQKGYEVLNSSGKVIRVVPPAPTKEQIAKIEAKRSLLQDFKRISRRYSSIDDIEAAKQRRLSNLDTNIALLRGNISGLNTQIDNLTSKAADRERAGKAIPKALLQQIVDTRAELAVTSELLQLRLDEYQQVIDKFDSEIAIYNKGSALQSAPN